MSRRVRAIGLAGAGVLVAWTASTVAAPQKREALASLVDAERAFARMSVATTQREAFLAYFADEGVWFTPAPGNTKEALRKQPAAAAGPVRVLDWDPVTGDVAASGDLGYTTGPWIATERGAAGAPAKTLGTGWFFSVWRWNPETGWRVAVDVGVDARHDRALRSQAFRPSEVRGVTPQVPLASQAAADELRAADAEFARRVAAGGWADALQSAATDDVRTYRGGHEPAVGRAAAMTLVAVGARPLTWQPSFALASSAGDLGYTYGAYADGTASAMVRGYYLHVWKRVPTGWKLAVDVAKVEPPAK
jgi:ketosteroid isomerase-like protein